MTNTNLLQAMGHIEPKLIADAAPDVAQKKSLNKIRLKWEVIAACLAVIVATVCVLPNYLSNQIDPIDVAPSNNPSSAVTNEPEKTITVIDLSQGNPGEFAGDMHRPEGFNENIGSALALKMSITDDVSYKYSVLVCIPKGSTLEQVLSLANKSLNMMINIADAVTINISGDFDTADSYYYHLTAEQIIALAENGILCLYVGSGQGDYKDMNWDTSEGINTYCELNGDMYVLAGGSIECHPDIFIVE